MGQQIRKMQTSVRFIGPQLANTVWIVISTSAAELQVEVVSGKNSDDMKAGSMSRQFIADLVSCSETFKNHIQGTSRPVLRREVPASSGPGKTVKSGGARTRAGRLV